MMTKIDVGRAYSKTPFGRYRTDGDFSAERFREEYLKPGLEQGDTLEIDFTAVALGVGSSFLEEAFGGLVRQGFAKNELLDRLVIKAKEDFYTEQVKNFIEVA